jgi:hypothetical protein
MKGNNYEVSVNIIIYCWRLCGVHHHHSMNLLHNKAYVCSQLFKMHNRILLFYFLHLGHSAECVCEKLNKHMYIQLHGIPWLRWAKQCSGKTQYIMHSTLPPTVTNTTKHVCCTNTDLDSLDLFSSRIISLRDVINMHDMVVCTSHKPYY